MNECFERELRTHIERTPELYNFTAEDFKEALKDSKIEIYEGVKDFDLLIKYRNELMYVDLYGYDEAGHCAFFNKKDYDFRLDGTDEELYTEILPARRKLLAKSVEDVGIFKKDIPVLEVFCLGDILNQIRRCWNGIHYKYNDIELKNEYSNIKKSRGDIKAPPTHNRIVKTFQPHMFWNQNRIYSNVVSRRELIQNRIKYRFKPEYELTDSELIAGCKIAGMCETYSYFSPLWFKYFIEKYKPKKVYDPFGGWGHRLLGSHDLELYIYNDISTPTYNGVCDIVNFLGIKNVEKHCENAETFKPVSNFDAVFTCPPYSNIEVYGSPISDFDSLIKNSLNCGDKLYGVVILEKHEKLLKINELVEKTPVNTQKSHFGKNNFEYLYVYR